MWARGHKEQPSESSPQQVLTLTDRTFAGVIATSNDQIMQFHDEKVHKIYGPTFSMAFPARNEESHLLISGPASAGPDRGRRFNDYCTVLPRTTVRH